MLIPKEVSALAHATSSPKDKRPAFECVKCSPNKFISCDTYMLFELEVGQDYDYPAVNEIPPLENWEPFLLHKDNISALEKTRSKKSTTYPALRDNLGAVLVQYNDAIKETRVGNTNCNSSNTVIEKCDEPYPEGVKIEDFYPTPEMKIFLKVKLLKKFVDTLYKLNPDDVGEFVCDGDKIGFEMTSDTGNKVKAMMLGVKKV